MTRAILPAALMLAACGSTTASVPSGQLSAPAGMAAVSAGDRDLLFIANSGRDGLVAIQLCNRALIDGGVDPADTCSPKENTQYVPGPIRVLAGTIETSERNARIAGARLTQAAPDGGTAVNGEVFTVGADQNLRVVDARFLIDAQEQRVSAADAGAVLAPLPLGALGVDVVAANALDPNTDLEVGSPSVRLFVATVAPAQLIAMTASLAPDGSARLPTRDGSCTLAPVVPKRIAVAPGKGDSVYVADSAGGGVVRVDLADVLKGGACTTRPISAGGRFVAALALSPPWYEGTASALVAHPSGEILMMVLAPAPGSTPGREVDPGGVLFARTSDGAILPLPPARYDGTGGTPMQPLIPLRSGGAGTNIAREATFLRAFRPSTAPGACAAAPCTPLNLGTASNSSAVGLQSFDLLAAVSTSDGATAFIRVPKRQFVTADAFLLPLTPTALQPVAVPGSTNAAGTGTLQPAQADPNAATLTTDTSGSIPGVARNSGWRVIWHAPMPGLERRAGRLTLTSPGTARFVTGPANLGTWTGDPILRLGPGDSAVVASAADSPNAACKDLGAAFNAAGASGTEFTITAISGGNTVDLNQPAKGPVLTAACPSLDVSLEVRTAGTNPWLIYDGTTPVGRWHTGERYVAHQRRYDYPLDLCPAGTPPFPCYTDATDARITGDVAFAFTISGNDPVTVAGFSITLSAPLPVTVVDASATLGLAGGILAYSSPRYPSLLFISLAGANEVLQADPAILYSATGGLQAYR